MSQTYYAILTAIGEAKLSNAAALNTTLKIAKMAVGDGGGVVPTPNRSQTALVGEWYRAGLNTLSVDPSNTSQIIAELVIPEATGGNWIREMGLIDAEGNLIAVANTPPSYKPQLAEGSGRTQVLRMVLIVSSASVVELKIDPSVVLATRQYVDDAITVAVNRLDNKQSVRVATTANLALSGTPTVDGIALAVGDRILVKNQDTASQNGLYLVAASAWNRALDADANSEVTPGLLVTVEEGVIQADTQWQLITDGAITLGITALIFAAYYNAIQVLALSQSGAARYAEDTGGTNAYAAAYTPTVTALTDGLVLRFTAKAANTGAATFAPNGVSAKPILGMAQATLQGGEILAGSRCAVQWSSAKGCWILLYASGGAQQVGTPSAGGHAINQDQANLAYATPIGTMRNGAMRVAAVSQSATFTADEVVVETALGGQSYRLANFSQTINLATTGAGGMDTGSAPATGFVALYAIYNPTTKAQGILAVNATAAKAPEVYGGSNMPSGYIASALVSVYPTNSSGQLVAGQQYDRDIYGNYSLAINTSTPKTSYTALSISTIVPINAKRALVSMSCTQSSSGSNVVLNLSGSADGIGGWGVQANSASSTSGSTSYGICPILTAQTLFYSMVNTNSGSYQIYINGYSF